jgi:hypothetical protein
LGVYSDKVKVFTVGIARILMNMASFENLEKTGTYLRVLIIR